MKHVNPRCFFFQYMRKIKLNANDGNRWTCCCRMILFLNFQWKHQTHPKYAINAHAKRFWTPFPICGQQRHVFFCSFPLILIFTGIHFCTAMENINIESWMNGFSKMFTVECRLMLSRLRLFLSMCFSSLA